MPASVHGRNRHEQDRGRFVAQHQRRVQVERERREQGGPDRGRERCAHERAAGHEPKRIRTALPPVETRRAALGRAARPDRIGRMPANRTSSLVAREGLGGPYFLLTFLHPETAREARPGQFVMIKAGLSAEPPLRRPFSILETSPERETFTLFVKRSARARSALASLPIGGFAQCLGPLGRPFGAARGRRRGADRRRRLRRRSLQLPGGRAAAPRWPRPRLFYGGRTTADLPLLARLREQGLDVVPATEDGSDRRQGTRHASSRSAPRRRLRSARGSTPAAPRR